MESALCADTVSESTFLSEYDLRFRGLGERAAFGENQERLSKQ